MEKRYQIFISSTYEDLQEERRAVSDALLSIDCIPVGMEEFPAADEEQFEFIKKIIDESDYYLLIVGGRYGSTCKDGISFTEKEFDYAVSKKKTILSFIQSERENIPCVKTDNDDSKREKLERFIKKVYDGRLKKDWKNKDELKYCVIQSVSHAKKTSPAVGYVKADTCNSEELLKQLNSLRIENESLKAKLQEKEENKIYIPDIAEIDESYDFTGLQRVDVGSKIEKTFSDNWLNLFISLAPNAMEGIDDETAKNIINKYIANKNSIKSFSLSDSSFNTIKIQLIALGLFDTDGFWQLTEKGKKYLLLNGAVKTKRNLCKESK